jgi:hypothetical protein
VAYYDSRSPVWVGGSSEVTSGLSKKWQNDDRDRYEEHKKSNDPFSSNHLFRLKVIWRASPI